MAQLPPTYDIPSSVTSFLVWGKAHPDPQIGQAVETCFETVINCTARKFAEVSGQVSGQGARRTPLPPAGNGSEGTQPSTRTRALSETGQKILAALNRVKDGMTIKMGVRSTKLEESAISRALPGLIKNGYVRQDGSRYYSCAVTGQPDTAAPTGTVATNKASSATKANTNSSATNTGTISISEGVLEGVTNTPDGATPQQIVTYLNSKYGLTIRPNHAGIALQRHRRAGRLVQSNGRWYLPGQAGIGTPPAAAQQQASAG